MHELTTMVNCQLKYPHHKTKKIKIVIYPLESLAACMTMVCKALTPKGDISLKK
jgi:hypothetical protein